MRLWLRARLDPFAWALVLVSSVLVPVLGTSDMPAPRVVFGRAPFLILLPALAATGVLAVLRRGLPVEEMRSVRPVVALWRALALGVCAALGLAWIAAGVFVHDVGSAVAAARNLVGYLGCGLIVTRYVGGMAALASPVVYAIAVAVLGTSTALWSWPLANGNNLAAVVVSVALCLVGTLVGLSRAALRHAAVGSSVADA